MKTKLLIVDDSIFAFEEIKFMLAGEEYEIGGYAKSGEAALEAYEDVRPHMVMMDIILPGMDGTEAAKLILEKWPEAAIVMVSSLAYDETARQAEEIGAKSVLFKPFTKEQLLDALAKAR